LEGLSKLHKIGLIHQDIKVNNILEKDTTFKYIDFGISMKKKEIFDIERNAIYLNADYMIHPPEYRYFSRYYYISKKIETIDMFVDNEWYLLHYIIGENKVRNIDLYKKIYNYDDYKKKLSDMFDVLKSKTKLQIIKSFTDQVNKIDIYSLGMVLLHIHPYLQMDKTSILAKSYITLLTNMINPNIFERYDTDDCINLIKQMIKLV
jgi:serine/threonine protein kinase